MPNNDEWLDIRAVSDEYPIAANTLYFWRHEGKGPKSYKVGRKVMYRRSELEAWLEAQASEQAS